MEKIDLLLAHDLMELAYSNRPSGTVIRNKLSSYKDELGLENEIEHKLKLKRLVDTGKIAIIPVGFRCFTASIIHEKLGIKQLSLPFNSGFFSPDSVASILSNPDVYMDYSGVGTNHDVCIKYENNNDENFGLGIKFESSTYDDINRFVVENDGKNLGSWLDATFGYYTLNKSHNFVLAHYNWHSLAGKSNINSGSEDNFKNINSIFIRRINRMMEMIARADYVFFVFGENQGYEYMQIDDSFSDLKNFENLKEVCLRKFGDKFKLIENIASDEIKASFILDMLGLN
ncbi:hypothetical protein R7127_26070 [Vibrio sp. 1159]|uniref:hypothetical protein n=1 Tax=Vibrio sp. 1159 TaxID=3074545 RepID=UPI002964921C|nr:hypothetical protein [Vibrio sp. 1159]MDW2323724.1 hypothetical protein [Vibrio sp. 1159]